MNQEVKTEVISNAPDLTILGLFFQADPFVKGGMFLLIFGSIWCWTIIINKTNVIRREKKLSSLKKNDHNKYLFYPNELNHIKIAEFIANKYSVEMNNSKKINILKIITLMSFLYFYHSILKILLFFFNNKKLIYIKNKRGKFFNDYNAKKIVRNIFKIRFCSIDIYLPR